MTKNFEFCNGDLLSLVNHEFAFFYNQFNNEDAILEKFATMGEYPKCKIEFKYNDEKRIRATFITFKDADAELDVKCACVLYHGDRMEYHCYFYEIYDNGSIGCVEVANMSSSDRVVRYLNAGYDTDEYFEKLCAFFGMSKYETTTVLFYNDGDGCYRILDMKPSDLELRSRRLLTSKPTITQETHGGIDFIFYKSTWDGSYLASRTNDGETIADVFLSDIDLLKK